MIQITTLLTGRNLLAGLALSLILMPGAVRAINIPVTNTNDAGAGSLRQAIITANSTPAVADVIQFNIAGAGPHTITLASALPALSTPITVDGYSQPGSGAGVLLIIVNGAGAVGNGFDINTAGPSTLRGLVIKNFTAFPVIITGVNSNTITGNYIGVDSDGATVAANGFNGITVVNSDNNTIGGIAAIDRNVVSGNNNHGISLENGCNNNTIIGNYIGINAGGTLDRGNGIHGINIDNSPANTVDRNIVSGNQQNGINVTITSTGCIITGNTVGLNATGTAAIANSSNGVSLFSNSTGCTVTNNTISGNQANGLNIDLNSGTATITANKIGTNAAGTAAVANGQNGIYINNSPTCTIGGVGTALRNIISGNANMGIAAATSNGLTFKANYIGLNAAGAAAIANAGCGIILDNCDNAVIGADNNNERNYISGNSQYGIYILNNSDNILIQGNYVGTSATGNSRVANNQHGIDIDGFTGPCDNISILNNVISGNGNSSGTLPSDPGAPTYFATGNGINAVNNCTGMIIRGNLIGLGADGTTALGNTENGIALADIPSVTIGGDRSNANQRNIICANAFHGIVLYQCNSFSVKGNIMGTDAGLTLNRGNQDSGIITINTTGGVIGGTGSNDGNILVNSKEEYGIRLQVSFTTDIKGNYIGTIPSGTVDMGNFLGGIYLMDYSAGCNSNIIGASATVPVAGEANIIAYNDGPGVTLQAYVAVARFNPIRGNSIYCNVSKGISLLTNGNNNKPAPVLDDVINANTISGTAAANDVIHIYRNPITDCGTCQGKIYVGTVNANGAGVWSFNHGLGLSLAEQRLITATATDASNNTSEFATCIILPVSFASFTATPTEENQTLLEWSTGSEKNNDYFVIERSADGIHWTAIGVVNGAGNSNTLLNYSYIDHSPENGINYYRLKQTDFDGKTQYSTIRTVNFSGNTGLQVFPNPTENGISVRVEGDGLVRAELLNTLGQSILAQEYDKHTIYLDLSALADGVYYLQVTSGGMNYVERIVKK